MRKCTRTCNYRRSAPYKRKKGGGNSIAFMIGGAVAVAFIYFMPTWLIWMTCGAILGFLIGSIICKKK